MLFFIVLIFLTGACYHAKSWKHLLRNIIIAETIQIIMLLVGVAGTAQIESDLPNMHRDYIAFFLGNLLLDTMLVLGAGFCPYALKKVFTRRTIAALSPADETLPLTKYWKTGVSFAIVVFAVACLFVGLVLLHLSFVIWTQPQPWTAGDHEFVPWVLGFGIVLFLAGGTLIALKLLRWTKKIHFKNPQRIVPEISSTTETEGKSYFASHPSGNRLGAWLAIVIVVAGMFLGVNKFAQKHFKERKPNVLITSYQYDVRRLEDAGFNYTEIQDWSIDQAVKLRRAGFSQDEVDDYQGIKPPVTDNTDNDWGRIPTDKDFHNAARITLNGCRPFYENAVSTLKGLFYGANIPPLQNPKRLSNETPAAYLVRIEMHLPNETPGAYLDRMRQLKETVLEEIREANAFPSFRDIMEHGTDCP